MNVSHIKSWATKNFLPTTSKKSAWRNFFIGITLATIIVLVAVWIFVGKKLPSLMSQAQTIISQEYPDDLEITFQDGVMESSYDEPFYYSLEELNTVIIEHQKPKNAMTQEELVAQWQGFENLLVIDDTQKVSLDTFEAYNALIVFFEDGAVLIDDEDGSVRVERYNIFGGGSEDGLVVDKESLDTFLQETAPKAVQSMKTVGLIGFFAIHWIALAFHLVGLALVALIAWGLISIKKSNKKYGDIFHDTLTLSLVPFVALAVVTVVTVDTHLWRFLGIMLIVVVAEGLYRREPEEIVTVGETPERSEEI